MANLIQHRGGCHCGQVRFEIDAPRQMNVLACNCSICRMGGFLHLIVPADRFRLLSDRAALSEYTFNTGVAKHLFCANCGIKSFYIPRSNPDGVSVNARCLELDTVEDLVIEPLDGQNWEENAAGLAHLSQ